MKPKTNRNNLEKIRLAANMTRQQLAKKLNTTETTIYRKEVGIRGLSDKEAPAYAKALGVSVEQLFINDKLYIPPAPDNNFREVDVAILDIMKILIDALVSGKPATRDTIDQVLANQETQYIKKGLKGAAPLIYALREHVNSSNNDKPHQSNSPVSRRGLAESHE